MKLIIALDFKEVSEALSFINELKTSLNEAEKSQIMLKIGMWLFYAAGPNIAQICREAGFEIFIDLKLNDIPNTIASATKALAAYKPSILSVHSAAGSAGLKAAVDAACGEFEIFAISVLTSMNEADIKELGHTNLVADLALKRAKLALNAGCAGCVCSAHEAASIRALGLKALSPGIRLANGDAHDQARVATPEFAKAQGANYIVVGRAILEAPHPNEVIKLILRSIND